ncbi:hypothetical protein pdam_00000450 [Pocillopora damicornis]|uniref:Uncharacterized protein n=1 Tax=Pocillopora damicornis TaxID=46731 RepID=A0A3M6UJC0_POCDA|nr:hypothetical protein pdam_00000450 [Pocillopora damicornis]
MKRDHAKEVEFSAYPDGHAQRYEDLVLMQRWEHPPLFLVHSLLPAEVRAGTYAKPPQSILGNCPTQPHIDDDVADHAAGNLKR